MDTSNIWCWLCPLLTGIISGIIGYYWGKSNSTTTNDCDEWIDKNRQLQLTNDKINADLKACLARPVPSTPSTASTAAGMATGFAAGAATDSSSSDTMHANMGAAPVLNFNADAAKAAMGKKIKADDLTVVEGIGPKISELFHNHDIKTWHGLSAASVEKCKEILQSGGKRFEIHNPGSWPQQAGMASNGEWSNLAQWQSEHKGGRL